MNSVFARLRHIFLILFAVITTGVMIWQIGWIWPRQNCEKAHKWWDDSRRTCAQPILISDVTGRIIADPKARAEALAAVGRAPKAE
jgi:hypothetical protein